jgi:rare lipoprotein A
MPTRHFLTTSSCVVLGCVLLMAACTGGASSQSTNVSGGTTQRGEASYYADKFEGRQTANGEIYTHRKRTAAHRTLPFGTRVRVTRLDTGAEVTVRINDRGPFKRGRIIDLSRSAAEAIGLITVGVADVEIQVLGGASSGSEPAPAPARDEGDTSTSW